LLSGKVTSEQLVKKAIDTFEADKKSPIPLNAFLEAYDDALELARAADKEIAAKTGSKPLLGIPFAVKDNISVKGKRLTCASKILQGYRAPYNATVIQRLVDAGAIPLGRCNMDEFAMGSSTEYSIYGPTRNPIDRAYVSGGSSGGPAAAVASLMAPFGLGTETGGSVRLPASYCGIYGLKTTYGVLSRWGVVAYGSSLDQVGLFGHTPEDIALALSVMVGKDVYDGTSEDLPDTRRRGATPECNTTGVQRPAACGGTVDAGDLAELQAASDSDLSQLKIAIPKQFLESKGLDPQVAACFDAMRDWFVSKGAVCTVVDLPILDAAIAAYYVIALSEAASNLSRFDGIRYGNRRDSGEGYDELYVKTRTEGFGAEVRRRIVIGNYVLSEQFSGDCYKRGMSVRARIQREVAALFGTYDLILCPTCPTPAFKLGQKVDDPLEMYLSDLYTTFVNLARIPSLSVPAGYSGHLPVGVQLAGSMFSEAKILRIAACWEQDHPGCGFP
jgi:aspartyl-tRNA(Asn)/glutamyl-tRNA(Gln) amidotransferase subunit A